MKQEYRDITSRIKEPPLWWDEEGVPRYEPFRPTMCGDIYAQQAVLLEISCQACHRRFFVAGTSRLPMARNPVVNVSSWRTSGYGDPPYDPDCPAGNTMTSETIRVVQFWRWKNGKWRRVRKLEVRLDGKNQHRGAVGRKD